MEHTYPGTIETENIIAEHLFNFLNSDQPLDSWSIEQRISWLIMSTNLYDIIGKYGGNIE